MKSVFVVSAWDGSSDRFVEFVRTFESRFDADEFIIDLNAERYKLNAAKLLIDEHMSEWEKINIEPVSPTTIPYTVIPGFNGKCEWREEHEPASENIAMSREIKTIDDQNNELRLKWQTEWNEWSSRFSAERNHFISSFIPCFSYNRYHYLRWNIFDVSEVQFTEKK